MQVNEDSQKCLKVTGLSNSSRPSSFCMFTWEPNPSGASGSLQFLEKFSQIPAHPNQEGLS